MVNSKGEPHRADLGRNSLANRSLYSLWDPMAGEGMSVPLPAPAPPTAPPPEAPTLLEAVPAAWVWVCAVDAEGAAPTPAASLGGCNVESPRKKRSVGW